jgi:hypothetical protein
MTLADAALLIITIGVMVIAFAVNIAVAVAWIAGRWR